MVINKLKSIFFLTFFLLFIITEYSCKKQNVISGGVNELQEKFFKVPAGTDTAVNAFVNAIKLKNDKFNFIEYFVTFNGYPLWNKTIYSKNNSVEIAIIPFSKGKEVNGFIAAQKNANGTYRFKVYKKDLLATYGYDTRASNFNISKVQTIINSFNLSIFNIDKFKLTNVKQIPKVNQQQFPDKLNLQKLYGKVISITNPGFNKKQSSLPQTNLISCTTFEEEVEIWYDPDGDDDPCDCSGNEYYLYTITESHTVCTVLGGGGGGGDEGDNGDEDDPGPGNQGPGGGGTGTGGPSADPYEYYWNEACQCQVPYMWWTGGLGTSGFVIQSFNTDNITNPCIASILNSIGEPGCQQFILKQYQELNTPSADIYKFRFEENNFLNSLGNAIPAHTDINTLPGGTKEIVITLNPAFLQNASKEYITLTILHELLHSFYKISSLYSNSTQAQQHQSMINKDIGKLVFALNELYPNLSATDALALSLQGYSDVVVDPTTNTFITVQEQLVYNKYGMNFSYALPLALAYLNGTKGTPC